jgi:hypothetical protein
MLLTEGTPTTAPKSATAQIANTEKILYRIFSVLAILFVLYINIGRKASKS